LKKKFLSIEQPSSPPLMESLEGKLILLKDNKTDHLRKKKNFRTTKHQEPVKLTIDNGQLHSSNRDIWNEHMSYISCKYLHTLVWELLSDILQDIPWQLCFTARSKKIQEKLFEVQYNLQNVFGYMLPPKESLSRSIKLTKSESLEQKRSSKNLWTRD
jgi:hypothetical protein